jgi:hypothetical protein
VSIQAKQTLYLVFGYLRSFYSNVEFIGGTCYQNMFNVDTIAKKRNGKEGVFGEKSFISR